MRTSYDFYDYEIETIVKQVLTNLRNKYHLHFDSFSLQPRQETRCFQFAGSDIIYVEGVEEDESGEGFMEIIKDELKKCSWKI